MFVCLFFFFLGGGGVKFFFFVCLCLRCFWGLFNTYILKRGVEQSSQWIVSRPDNLARKQ